MLLYDLLLMGTLAASGMPAEWLAAMLIANPVDAALRTFRAYHILNTWSPTDNFGFNANVVKINRLLFTYLDYAAIGYRP